MGLLQALGLKPTRRMAEAPTAGAAPEAAGDATADSAVGASAASPARLGGSGRQPETGTQPVHAHDPPQVPPRTPPRAPARPLPQPPTPSAIPPTSPVTATGPEADAFNKERAAVKALVDSLTQHAQAKRIAGLLAQIASKLAAADASASQSKWTQAMADLTAVRQQHQRAKKAADDWADYATARAVVAAIALSLRGLDDAKATTVNNDLAAADAKMAANPPDLVGAKATLTATQNALLPYYQVRVNDLHNVHNQLLTYDAKIQQFLKADIDSAKTVLARLDASLAAKQWSAVLMDWRAGWDVLGPCVRYANRRFAFNQQRANTDIQLAIVKSQDSIKDQHARLQAMVQEAEALAGRDTMKIEAGLAKLQQAAALGQALGGLVPTIALYLQEKAAAQALLKEMQSSAMKDAVADRLAAAQALFDQAAASETTARAAADNPAAPWQAALTGMQRVKGDLGAIKSTAATLGPALAAQKAGNSQNADAMKRALASLTTDLAKAMNGPDAAAAQTELQDCKAKADAAAAALKANNTADAGKALAEAGAALTRAREVQGSHAQFGIELKVVEAQGAALMQLPNAKKIVPALEAVTQALKAARDADKARDPVAALKAVRRAAELVAAARKADADRGKHDTLAQQASARLPEIADKNQNKALAAELAAADALADKLDFDAAAKAVKAVLVKFDQAKLKAGMATNPPDPKLRDLVRSMVANGGKAEVDDAIQNAPAGQPKVITELASARYGKEFTFESASAGANEVDSMKRCCEVFSKIDDDITNNPSVADISHVDATGSAGGGYTNSNAHIGMVGRRGIQQKFGTDEEHFDTKQGKNVKSLPPDIDKDCQPAKGGNEEYLGFAAAHEVGHGVDDRHGFMNKNGKGEAYGGWESYGSDVQPVAAAVGPKIASEHAASTFYKTPESQKYVLDKLMNRPPARPPEATPGDPKFVKAESDAYDAFDKWHAIATSDDVYRRQGDCDAIKIGDRIYHEAYPRAWVSYLAAARKKGLTGYQFRAPAEWFAELYAGWKCGWLGDKHPALEWLKKL